MRSRLLRSRASSFLSMPKLRPDAPCGVLTLERRIFASVSFAELISVGELQEDKREAP